MHLPREGGNSQCGCSHLPRPTCPSSGALGTAVPHRDPDAQSPLSGAFTERINPPFPSTGIVSSGMGFGWFREGRQRRCGQDASRWPHRSVCGGAEQGTPVRKGPGGAATSSALARTAFSVTAAPIIPCKSSGATRVALAGKARRMLCCRRPADGWQHELQRRGFEPFHQM